MPETFASFHPLGYVLVVMLGAGVAERTGCLPQRCPEPSTGRQNSAYAGGSLDRDGWNLAADAAYVVLIPLAGVIFSAAGRHPIAGIAAAFAGVSGGFSANLLPGQLDALLFGITEAAAESVLPAWDANIAGNAYFIVGMTFVFLPVIWFVTDKIIEPRLLPVTPQVGDEPAAHDQRESGASLLPAEIQGLKRAGFAALAVIWFGFSLCGTRHALIDESANPEARLNPLFRSLVAGFFILFLVTGWAYGTASGSVNSHRDIVRMMSESMSDLSYYLVLAFAAAHFVAMFNWSNLG